MTIIFFVLVQSRKKFVIHLLESILKLKNTKVLLMQFLLFIWLPNFNIWQLSTFTPSKWWRETWKIFSSVKNGFSVKNLFWTILGLKMMSSLNFGCNINIRAYYLCKILAYHRVIKNIRDAFITFTKSLLGKILLPSGAIFHGLHLFSLIVPSSHLITTPVCGFYAVFAIVLVGMNLRS